MLRRKPFSPCGMPRHITDSRTEFGVGVSKIFQFLWLKAKTLREKGVPIDGNENTHERENHAPGSLIVVLVKNPLETDKEKDGWQSPNDGQPALLAAIFLVFRFP